MKTVKVEGWDRCKIPPYKTKYDSSTFVNTGEFFDTHPGVMPQVRRYEQLDEKGDIIESWERDKNGVMVNVTKRDALYKELIEAQEAIDKLTGGNT